MKKIILFHPATQHEKFYTFFWIPYSLLSIGSVISDLVDVQIIDENLDDIELTKYDIENVLCVGISSMIGSQISNGLKFANKIRKLNSDIPIVWGGHLPSILPELTLKNKYVDVIVIGQGEFTFREYVEALIEGKNLDNINNMGFINSQGIVKINNNNLISSRKKLLTFHWELVEPERYIRKDSNLGSRILNYVSSIGCPFPCTFCAEKPMYGKSWHPFSIEKVKQDIDYLSNKYNLDAIKFYDANFFGNKKVAIEIIQWLFKHHQLNWAASGHPKTLNELKDSEWELLKASGCKRLLIGAESGNQNALNVIKKKITPEIIINLAKKCSQYNIIGSFTFIVGFPGCDFLEEKNSTLKIGSLIRQIDKNNEVKIHFYAPFPNTELYKQALLYGFAEPKTLLEWAEYDYYNIETTWINKKYEKEIHNFNNNNCKYVHL